MLHRTVMGDIAFPSAGDKELHARTGIPLQKHDAGAGLGSTGRGQKPCAAGTDDNDGFHRGS